MDFNKERDEYPSKDVILEEVRVRRTIEFARIDALDTKAGLCIVAVLVFFELLVQRINLKNLTRNKETIFMLLSFVCALFSLFFTLWSIRIRPYRSDPKIDNLIEKYLGKHADETKRELIASYQDALRNVMLDGNKKALFVKIGWEFLIYTIIFYLASIWELFTLFAICIFLGCRYIDKKEVKKNGRRKK